MQAIRTGFRTRKEAIDFYVALSCLLGFVFEHRCERPPTCVTDGLSQTVIPLDILPGMNAGDSKPSRVWFLP